MTAIQISQSRRLTRSSIVRHLTATLRALDAALLERLATVSSAERRPLNACLLRDIGLSPSELEVDGNETGAWDAIACHGLGADHFKRWVIRSLASADQAAPGGD